MLSTYMQPSSPVYHPSPLPAGWRYGLAAGLLRSVTAAAATVRAPRAGAAAASCCCCCWGPWAAAVVWFGVGAIA
jgi:hypothetical protein